MNISEQQVLIKNENNYFYNKQLSNAVAVFVLCSFLMQYIINILDSYLLYIFILGIAAALIFISKRRRYVPKRLSFITAWVLAVCVVTLNVIRTPFDINVYVDAYAMCLCLIMVICCGEDLIVFQKSFKIVYYFAIFFSFSIFVQILLPSVYDVFLQLLPERSRSYIVQFERTNVGFTGFSTNPGFTAGYIVEGLLLLISLFLSNAKIKKMKTVMLFLFFVIALFLTGKRGHLLAFVLSAMLVYLFSTKGKNKFNRINMIILLFVFVVIFFLLFGDLLAFIPAFSRFSETITGLLQGEDVSSNRLRLYEFGVELFKDNPIFGVGWGQYRVLTVGNVTLVRTIETHNIYLQMLCEMGILGFMFMITAMVSSLLATIKNLNHNLSQFVNCNDWKTALLFSLGYQVFFLVYGMTGNPLYDQNYVLMYFFSLAISAAYVRYVRNKSFLIGVD